MITTTAPATSTLPTEFVPCTDECMFAKGEDCDCHCGGTNHRVGTFGLLPAELLVITRTRAGRRITPILLGDEEYNLAVIFTMEHDEGATKREIAAAYGVSQPTVRRYITRLALAEELEEEFSA